MSTATLSSPAAIEPEPTTEAVARYLYVERENRFPVFCQTVGSDFALPGFEQRAQKFIAGAEPAERTAFKAESADVRSMVRILLDEAGRSPLFRPDTGKPIPNEHFAGTGEDWVQLLVSIGAVPRAGAVSRYREARRREREAAQTEVRPNPLSQTIGETLSRYRSSRQREMWTRLHQLIADASSKGLSDFVLAELATVADQLDLTDEKIAREFEAFENH